MKKLCTFAAVLILTFLFTGIINAQSLFIDNFSYTAGVNLVPNGGWAVTGTTVTTPIQTIATGLTYTGYIGSGIGGAVQFGISGEDDNHPFSGSDSVSSGSVYCSFLVNCSAAQTAGDYFIHFGDGGSTNFVARTGIRASATNGFDFGIIKNSTGGAQQWTNQTLAFNTTYLVVIKYIYNTVSITDDSVALFVNPVLSTSEPTPTIGTAAGNDMGTSGSPIRTINFRQGTAANTPTVQVDGIRVTRLWSELASNSLIGDYYIPQGTHPQGFATLAAACTALNTLGVAAPVRILIDADLAETGATLLIKKVNTTATNTVTILPNTSASHTITITGCATSGDNSKSGLTIDSTNYVTIDGSNGSGSNLTFIMSDGTNGSMLINNTGSSYTTIQNCSLTWTAEPASNTGIEAQYTSAGLLPSNNITIQNVKIGSATMAPRYGVYTKGKAYPNFSTNMLLKNNTIYALGVGLNLNYFGTPSNVNEISGNTFYLGSATWVTGYVEGIFFADYGGTINIFNNKILSMASNLPAASTFGMIGIATMYGAQSGTILNIYNNFITGFSCNSAYNNNIYGMWFEEAPSSPLTYPTVNLYYNTIYMNPTGASGVYDVAVGRIDGWGGNITMKDNILYNANGTATSWAAYFPNTGATPGTIVSDYNDLYVTGSGYIGEFGVTVDCSTLAAWRTASSNDPNSISKLTTFVSNVSPFDLHLAGTSNGDISLRGVPVTGTTTDIDGQTRNVTYPYMGADEASVSLPVELTTFTANLNSHSVVLNWKTATEINNKGFEIERSINSVLWENVGFINGAGNSTSANNYSFTDASLSNAGVYSYRLKQIDYNGSYKLSNTVEVNYTTPANFSLLQNYPNPFNPSTIISYSLPKATNVKLLVYNAIGQNVKVLENGYKEAGIYNVSFNASELPSGLYFYKIEAGQFSQVRKMMLLK